MNNPNQPDRYSDTSQTLEHDLRLDTPVGKTFELLRMVTELILTRSNLQAVYGSGRVGLDGPQLDAIYQSSKEEAERLKNSLNLVWRIFDSWDDVEYVDGFLSAAQKALVNTPIQHLLPYIIQLASLLSRGKNLNEISAESLIGSFGKS